MNKKELRHTVTDNLWASFCKYRRMSKAPLDKQLALLEEVSDNLKWAIEAHTELKKGTIKLLINKLKEK